MVSKENYAVDLIDSRTNRLIPFNTTYSSFYLENGTEYKILLTNNNWRCRANAKVIIDGQYIGTFRIQQNDKIEIERPVNHEQNFTFKTGQTGTLRVEFEKESLLVRPKIYSTDNDTPEATALGKKSSCQQFYEVGNIDVEDEKIILDSKMVFFQYPPQSSSVMVV